MAVLAGLTSVTLGKAGAGTPANVAGTSGYGNAEGNRQGAINDKYREYDVTIVFGDGSSTYPASGIPLATTGVSGTLVPGSSTTYLSGSTELCSAVTFGYRSSLKQLDMYDLSNGDGYVYKFNKTGLTLRIYQVATIASGTAGAAAAALTEVPSGFAPASGVTLYGRAKGR